MSERHEVQQGPASGSGQPPHQCRLGDEGIESSPVEEDLGVLVDEKLDVTQQCACSPEGQPCPGLHQKQRGQQVEGHDSTPLLCSGESPPGVQLWSPQHRTDMDLLEWVQRRATKMIRGTEHLCYEERLRELGLFSLKRRWQGDLRASCQYLKGAYRKGEEKVFSRACATGIT